MCVSKARLKDYISSLPMTDMKKIDKAIAKTVGLFSYYLDLKNRLNDKLNYMHMTEKWCACSAPSVYL